MNVITAIKSRLSITDAAQLFAHRQLVRRGDTLWCSCLNNSDSSPSMQLNTHSDHYRCFSCHDFGDQIDLVASAMNLTNSEAIKYLADHYGLRFDLSLAERVKIDLERKVREEARRVRLEQEQVVDTEYHRLCRIERKMWRVLKELRAENILSEQAEQALRWQSRLSDVLGRWLDADSLEDRLDLCEATKDWREFN